MDFFEDLFGGGSAPSPVKRPDPISDLIDITRRAARGDYDEQVGRAVEDTASALSGNDPSRTSFTRRTRATRPQRVERRQAREGDLDEVMGIDMSGTSSSEGGRYLPSRKQVDEWNNMVSASDRLQNLIDTAERNNMGRYSNDLSTFTFDREQDTRTAQSLRAVIYTYRSNRANCYTGDANACRALGREVGDRAYSNPQQGSYEDARHPQFTTNPNPPAPAVEPEDSHTEQAGGGAEGEGLAPPAVEPAPHTEPDREGEAHDNPHEAHSGAGGTGHHEHDNQKHRDPVSGGGTHDGRSGRASHGDQTVVPLEPHGNNVKRRRNVQKQHLKTLMALQNPFLKEQQRLGSGRYVY